MERKTSTVTERGQVSIPAALRRAMRLRSGQTLRWEQISDRECRVTVDLSAGPDPLAALGMGPQLRGDKARSTAAWMKQIREGEK
jgi:AbrB family looped-hinge helix DNA binding protein